MKRPIAIATVALALAGVSSASTGPTLRLVSTKPFVVDGTHFKAREGVLATLSTDRTRIVRRTMATRTGTFSVDFGIVALSRCNGFGVRAVGSKGSSAFLKRPPLPACMPERSP